MTKNDKEIRATLKDIINKKERAMEAWEAPKDDLLGILLESNHREIQEHENSKADGMTNDEVMQECKLFYFAGQETTSFLLVWTMVLFSEYPEWQKRAREETLRYRPSLLHDYILSCFAFLQLQFYITLIVS